MHKTMINSVLVIQKDNSIIKTVTKIFQNCNVKDTISDHAIQVWSISKINIVGVTYLWYIFQLWGTWLPVRITIKCICLMQGFLNPPFTIFKTVGYQVYCYTLCLTLWLWMLVNIIEKHYWHITMLFLIIMFIVNSRS